MEPAQEPSMAICLGSFILPACSSEPRSSSKSAVGYIYYACGARFPSQTNEHWAWCPISDSHKMRQTLIREILLFLDQKMQKLQEKAKEQRGEEWKGDTRWKREGEGTKGREERGKREVDERKGKDAVCGDIIILAPEKQRQELSYNIEVSHGYTMRPCLEKV